MAIIDVPGDPVKNVRFRKTIVPQADVFATAGEAIDWAQAQLAPEAIDAHALYWLTDNLLDAIATLGAYAAVTQGPVTFLHVESEEAWQSGWKDSPSHGRRNTVLILPDGRVEFQALDEDQHETTRIISETDIVLLFVLWQRSLLVEALTDLIEDNENGRTLPHLTEATRDNIRDLARCVDIG